MVDRRAALGKTRMPVRGPAWLDGLEPVHDLFTEPQKDREQVL